MEIIIGGKGNSNEISATTASNPLVVVLHTPMRLAAGDDRTEALLEWMCVSLLIFDLDNFHYRDSHLSCAHGMNDVLDRSLRQMANTDTPFSRPRRIYPHIDGIRALAVLPVMFFHILATLFPGGFAGVDVFFVISGYLITGGILRDLKNDRFTIRNFYLPPHPAHHARLFRVDRWRVCRRVPLLSMPHP